MHSDNTVATLTNFGDGVIFADSSRSAKPGDRLESGVIEIAKGSIALTFDCGALVNLEGPAKITLESEYRARLEFGQVRADVPTQAIGFLLTTPGGLIRDLGTSFGVSVQRSGSTELHVLDGKVEATPISADVGSVPKLVTENQAVRLATSTVESTAFNGKQFANSLPPAPHTKPEERTYSTRRCGDGRRSLCASVASDCGTAGLGDMGANRELRFRRMVSDAHCFREAQGQVHL